MRVQSNQRTNKLISLVMLLQLSGHLLAQQSQLEIGATLKAQNEVKLRTAPPSQKYLFVIAEPGNEINKLQQGEKIKVQEIKEIAIPLGKDIWLKGMTEKGQTGWVYYGTKDQSTNFIRSPQEQ